MKPKLKWLYFWSAASGLLGIIFLMVSLGPRRIVDPPPDPPAGHAGSVPPGMAVFSSQGCERCHRLGGRGLGLGPPLDHVGKRRTRAWLESFLRDPRGRFPKTIMPAYGNLPLKELRALADYLARLK